MQYVAIGLLLAIAFMGARLHQVTQQRDSAITAKDRLTRHWDHKIGGTALLSEEFINYRLTTFDSGKHWYAYEVDQDSGMHILGEAEQIYPGLLSQIEGMNQLIEHATANGALQIASTDGPEATLLRNAGFGVVSTEEKE